MDPATRYCNRCLDEMPCACPASRDHADTLLVRLCLGAHAAATEEIRYLEGRTLDRTGDRLARTEARIWRLHMVKAWCTRQLWRRRIAPPVLTDHDAIQGQALDEIAWTR